MSAASVGIGAAQNASNARKQQQNLDAEKAANEAYRSRYYFEDPLARAGARRMMQQQMENVQRLNRSAAGTRAVVGGTEESVAATQQAGANALAETAGNIVQQSDARKDRVDENYMGVRKQLAAHQQEMDVTKANNVATSVKGALQTAGNIATGIDNPDANRSVKYDEDNDVWMPGRMKPLPKEDEWQSGRVKRVRE